MLDTIVSVQSRLGNSPHADCSFQIFISGDKEYSFRTTNPTLK